MQTLRNEDFYIDKSDETKALFGGTVAFKRFGTDFLGECGPIPASGVPLNPCRRLLSDLNEDLKSKITLPETTTQEQIDYFANIANGKFWLGLFTKTTANECEKGNITKIGRCYRLMSDPDSQRHACQEFPPSKITWAPGEPNQCNETYLAYRPKKDNDGDVGMMDLGSQQERWKSQIICVYIAPPITDVCLP